MGENDSVSCNVTFLVKKNLDHCSRCISSWIHFLSVNKCSNVTIMFSNIKKNYKLKI